MIELNVTEGTALVGGFAYQFDSQSLIESNVVYAQWDGVGGFYEREPFVGKEDGPDIMSLVQAAANEVQSAHDAAMNPPPLTPQEALEQERATMVVSRFQARAALFNAGFLAAAESAISGASDLAQLAWQDAWEFRRNSPTVAAIAGTLGLTDTQLDDLFRQAATIEA